MSKQALKSVFVLALLFSACGTDEPPVQGGSQNQGDGDGDRESGDGDTGEGDGDTGDGDTGDGDTGDGDTGDGDTGDGDGDAPAGAGPVIPKASMTCPSLKSGTQTIMDLETTIIAGTPSKDKTGPLLIYWHGTGSQPGELLGTLPAGVRNEITAQGGMIVAAHDPSAQGAPAREGTDVTYGGVWFTTHDYAFADLIVACAVQNHGIDPRRIYTTGCSAGGLMAGRMDVEHNAYFAAVSANSGGLTSAYGIKAPTKAPPPVFLMYGAPDADAKMTLGIAFEPMASTLATMVLGAKGFAIKCQHSAGHCAAPAELQTAAWQFMKDHPYGTTTSPYAKTGLPKSFPSYCQIAK